jgi:PAS domain S-box-containing protein
VALFVASRPRLGATRVVLGSVVMGSGIAGMHYIGMAAMRLPAHMEWQVGLVMLSVIIAVTVSAVALLLVSRFGHEPLDRWTWRKVGAAVVMGLAVCSMHYTGMAAATFVPAPAPVATGAALPVTALGAAATTLVVLALAIGTSLVARYGEEQLRISADLIGVRERQLAEAQAIAHVGSWELDMTTNRVTWSEESYRMYGVPMGSPVGYETFVSSLHPDDRERVERVVGEALTQRRPVEFEYRMLRPDGEVRTLLGRNVVIFNAAGAPVRLAGTALDITERTGIEDALRSTLLEVKTLRGYLRVCANCKRVLGQDGFWEQLESYVRRHTEAEFSHGICPDCAKTWAAAAV